MVFPYQLAFRNEWLRIGCPEDIVTASPLRDPSNSAEYSRRHFLCALMVLLGAYQNS